MELKSRKLIRELSLKDKSAVIAGWIHELRDLAKIKFILLRDVSGILQCIVKDEKLFKKFSELTIESVIALKGAPKKADIKSIDVSHKDFEFEIDDIEIISKAEVLPITVTEKGVNIGLSKRLDYRSIDLRKRKNLAIFRIQAALIEGMQKYLNDNNFVQVFTPSLLGTSSESGSEVFQVIYYDKKAYLRQDPQLHRQLAVAGGFEKIYDIGPSWRAEQSHTVKHLTEHRTCAAEIAFISSEQDTMRIEEQVIISALKNVKEKCQDELKLIGADIKIPKTPFPELKFPEIYSILKKLGKNIKVGDDVDAEADKLLADYVKKKFDCDFFFINGFPFKLKPFYVYHDSDYARSVDLYCKSFELSSGGQREHRYDVLMKNLKEKKLNINNLKWFTDFFRYGVPSHGGFSIGIERLTQVLLGIENIREAVLFPRDSERLEP